MKVGMNEKGAKIRSESGKHEHNQRNAAIDASWRTRSMLDY